MRLHRRGAVLLFVLVAIAVLGILVAAYYSQAGESQLTAQSVAAQQVAMSRAEKGLQEALRRLRTGGIVIAGITPCTEADPLNCPAGTFVYQAPVDNGQATYLEQGGGLEYDFVVFKRPLLGAPPNRYNVRATGFYGYTRTATNLATAVVEAEIDVGRDNRFRCADDYECR
jgi:type II secretory pathway pseudopilin PulG